MINHEEQTRRAQCMRRWYFSHPCAMRSAIRRHICSQSSCSNRAFYFMLKGCTYISDERVTVINRVINRGTIPGLDVDIFTN